MNIEELKCALQNGARQETARLISRHFAERRCVEGAVGDILRVLSFCPPEERIYLLRQSIQHAPRETALYVELVRHQLQQQEYEQAEWWWGIAIKIGARSAALWALGVDVALGRYDLQLAETAMDRFSQLAPEDTKTLARLKASHAYAKGVELWQTNKRDQALFWIRRAIVDAPHWEEPRLTLADYLNELGRPNSAIKYAHSTPSSGIPTLRSISPTSPTHAVIVPIECAEIS